MKSTEFAHILAAIIILTVVASLKYILYAKWSLVPQILLYSIIIILVAVIAKKVMAYLLDAGVEHELWTMSRYGFRPHDYLKDPLPTGIIFPLVLGLFSLGKLKVPALLTYETRASKYRAAKRHGFYSFTEITEWHNGLIGASSAVAMFILAIITYLLPTNLEYLSALASAYAFFNLIPISKLDGTQIYFGSKVLWATLAIISIIFMIYSLPVYF